MGSWVWVDPSLQIRKGGEFRFTIFRNRWDSTGVKRASFGIKHPDLMHVYGRYGNQRERTHRPMSCRAKRPVPDFSPGWTERGRLAAKRPFKGMGVEGNIHREFHGVSSVFHPNTMGFLQMFPLKPLIHGTGRLTHLGWVSRGQGRHIFHAWMVWGLSFFFSLLRVSQGQYDGMSMMGVDMSGFPSTKHLR